MGRDAGPHDEDDAGPYTDAGNTPINICSQPSSIGPVISDTTLPQTDYHITERGTVLHNVTIELEGTVFVEASEVTFDNVRIHCNAHMNGSSRIAHAGDGLVLQATNGVRLQRVYIDGCGGRGIYLHDGNENDLAEVFVRATSGTAIVLENSHRNVLAGISIGSFSAKGQGGSPCGSGIELKNSNDNQIISAFIAGGSGAEFGPAIKIWGTSRGNQTIRSRARFGSEAAQSFVCESPDNLWHQNTCTETLDISGNPTSNCGCFYVLTDRGKNEDHGNPEAPDPQDPSKRRFPQRVWTACESDSFGSGHTCDVGLEDPSNLQKLINGTEFGGSTFRDGDRILIDTNTSTDVDWPTVAVNRPLSLIGNTRTQKGSYDYDVIFESINVTSSCVRLQHLIADQISTAADTTRIDVKTR